MIVDDTEQMLELQEYWHLIHYQKGGGSAAIDNVLDAPSGTPWDRWQDNLLDGCFTGCVADAVCAVRLCTRLVCCHSQSYEFEPVPSDLERCKCSRVSCR